MLGFVVLGGLAMGQVQVHGHGTRGTPYFSRGRKGLASAHGRAVYYVLEQVVVCLSTVPLELENTLNAA